MASTLEKVANICLIFACTIVVGEYAYRQVKKSAKTHALYSAGEHIPVPKVAAINSGRLLIVAVSSTCHFCQQSLPSYKHVIDAAHKVGTKVIAVAAEPTAANQTFLNSNGITVDSSLSLTESGMSIPTVPSLILARGDGTVIESWTGLADAGFERSALGAVARN